MKRIQTIQTALSIILLAGVIISNSYGETGMCLVVCANSFDAAGDIRRIDVSNDAVSNTSSSLGTGISPRFSPDGSQFACINGTTVTIANLDGSVIKTFNVAESGKLSYTSNGIYIGSSGEIRLYDLNGNKTWEKSFSYCSGAFVAQNGSIGTGVAKKNNWNVHIYYLSNGTTKSIDDEQGCSAVPSPDGAYFTQNQHGHITMRIRKSDGSIYMNLDLLSCTGMSPTNGNWRWNRQGWSGNADNWIILPVGQAGSASSEQLDNNSSPFIYNIATQQHLRLASRSSDFWQPYDYYSGKIYNDNEPHLTLSKGALEFQADVGTNPSSQTITASTAVSTLESLQISGAQQWLTVTPSATSGNSITLTNAVNAAGISEGLYNDTVTVTTSNAGQKTYTVSLSVKANPVLTSIKIDPQIALAAPGQTASFTAMALDQHDDPMATQPSFTWSVSGGGTIDNQGTFTAGSTTGGPFTITASSGSIEGTARVRVADAPDIHIKVNCGSNTFAVSGWDSDDDYLTGGEDHTWSSAVSTSGVANAAPDDVYKSVIHRDHSYSFDVPNGDYIIRLHLSDEYGNRTMNYAAEGIDLLTDFDVIAEAGGASIALVKDLPVSVSDGNGLQLSCTGGEGDVFENGLEIIGFKASQPLTLTVPTSGQEFKVGSELVVTWEATVAIGGIVVEFSPDGDEYYPLTLGNSVSPNDTEWPTFTWTITSTVGPLQVSTVSSACRIRIYDYLNESLTAESQPFTITTNDATYNDIAHMHRRGYHARAIGTNGIRFELAHPASIRILQMNGAAVYQSAPERTGVVTVGNLADGVYAVEIAGAQHTLRSRITVGARSK